MICVGISKIKKKEKYLCNACDDGKDSSQQDWPEQPPLDTDLADEENNNKPTTEQLNSSPTRLSRSSKKLKNETETENNSNQVENVNNSENNLIELNESTQR
jgi:hypothetical protein